MNAVFVGRGRELETLTAGLDRAIEGAGGLAWLSGEPGIGKTRLAEELSRRAAERGCIAAWGRSWEGPGTPAFWPWMQILRQLAAHRELGAHFAAPEIQEMLGAGSAAADQGEARFRLFDAVNQALLGAAADRPLLLVLDDAHDADAATLLLLQFIARQLRSSGLYLLVTARDSQFQASEQIGELLAKVAREAQQVPLARLGREELSSWITQVAPQLAGKLEKLYETSEGNPLFVGELLAAAHKRPDDWGMPRGVTEAVRQHLSLLSAPALALLKTASVLGRDFSLRALNALVPAPSALIDEAVALGVLTQLDEGRLRFGHVLLRDELYGWLHEERRRELHLAAAAAAEEPETVAHHQLLAGGPDALPAVRAGMKDANRRLAFEDAAALGERALTTLQLGERDQCELLIEIGQAQILAGNQLAGRAECLNASEIAERLHDGVLSARAALAATSDLGFGRKPENERLLSRALALLDEKSSALRAQVMARLSAAMVPREPHEGDEFLQLRDASIEMARAVGDRAALLYTVRLAASIFPDALTREERRTYVREAIDLAEQMGQVAHVVTILGWNVAADFEVGDPDGAMRQVERAERLLGAFRQPQYHWRAPLLRAMIAGIYGRFDEGYRLADEAKRIARTHQLWDADFHQSNCRIGIQYCRGDSDGMPEDFEDLVVPTRRLRGSNSKLFLSLYHAVRGDLESTREALDQLKHTRLDLQPGVGGLAWATVWGGNAEHAALIYDGAPLYMRNVAIQFGPGGLTCMGPNGLALGRLAMKLGRDGEAEPHFRGALERSEKIRSQPFIAQIELAWAQLEVRQNRPDAAKRRAERAQKIAASLGMRRVREESEGILGARSPAPAPAAPAPKAVLPSFELSRQGELWQLGPLLFKDSKGLQYLEVLMRAPGREVHVLDLVGSEIDGDAGEHLDQKARQAYRRRAEELRGELEEAQAHNDRGRVDRIHHELEALGDELSRAFGLGGRARKVGSFAERARVNVQRRLRDVIRRVEEKDSALAKHLELSLKTGVLCSYQPVWTR